MSSIIEIQNLQFSYPAQIKSSLNGQPSEPTLKIAQFKLQAKEKFFVFGPSGSGKTTFLEILAGILTPQKGTLRILGQSIESMTNAQKDEFRALHIGYIFQSFNLIPYLSAEENILLPFSLHKKLSQKFSPAHIQNKLKHLSERLGLTPLLKKSVLEMSVGQQQRVAVARALITEPALILADEPTSALDMDHREKFLEVLFQLCDEQGTSVIFVSHDRSIQKLFTRAESLFEISRAH